MSGVAAVNGATELTPYTLSGRIDPFAIYQLNFEARGGEKYVKYDSSFSFKGEMQLGDMTFGIEEYKKFPLKSLRRISSNFKVIFQNGDDGKNLWTFQDDNLRIFNDSESPDRQVRKLWEEYAYTDPKNRVFSSTATRKISIDGTNCYEIKIKNNKTDEVVTQYYDADSFLLKRELRETKSERIQIDFDDWRAVGNILMPFRETSMNLDTLAKQVLSWDKIEKGVYLSEGLFLAPEDKAKNTDLSTLTGTGQRVDRYV
jgi:hypothetical protein